MTRQNLSPNPALKNNATGYTGTGSPARLTGLTGLPRTTGVGPTGGGYIQTPASTCAPSDIFTVSFYLKNNTGLSQTGKTCYVSYTRSAGGDVFPETFSFAAGAVGTVTRFSFTAAAAPALATGIYLVLDSLIAGFEFTAFLPEKVGALDTYFDGDTASASWDGTNGDSTSTLADASTTFTSDLDLRNSINGSFTSDLDLRLGVGGQFTSDLDIRTRILADVTTSSTVSGSWYGLSETYRENVRWRREEQRNGPVACPNDGEPLTRDARGRLHCPFDGWTG